MGPLTYGYYLGAAIMLIGGVVVAWFYGINAEGQSLEDIADPLSKVHTLVRRQRGHLVAGGPVMTAARPYTVVVGVSATSRISGRCDAGRVDAGRSIAHGVVIASAGLATAAARIRPTVGARPPVPEGDSGGAVRSAPRPNSSSDVLRRSLGVELDRVECRLVLGGRRKALRSISSVRRPVGDRRARDGRICGRRRCFARRLILHGPVSGGGHAGRHCRAERYARRRRG